MPKKEVVRVRKVKDKKRRYIIDFRGIRSSNKAIDTQRPRGQKGAFTNPETLKNRIQEYFDSCFGPAVNYKTYKKLLDEDGNPVRVRIKPYTVTGLCYYLDIEKSTLDSYCWGKFDVDMGDYGGTYSEILKKAKRSIELFVEENLYNKDSYNGSRFVLDAAFGWKTQKESAEILEKLSNIDIRKQELELKKKLLDDDSEDNNIEIRITRKNSRDKERVEDED